MSIKHKLKATVCDAKGRVLAIAHNSYSKTHPYQYELAEQIGGKHKHRVYLHAEIAAIIKAQKVGTPYSIHVERYYKDGTPAIAKPCPICQLAIELAGIEEVTHT